MRWLIGYALVIATVTGGLLLRQISAENQKKSEENKKMSWTELTPIDVEAKGKGLWTWGYEWIDAPSLIKFEADGEWHYSPGAKGCGPDGDLDAQICSRNCLMPDAPAGALLAKVGGSTAGIKDGKVFLVGRMAVIQTDQSGPLLLSINDEVTGMGDNSGTLKVRIWVKKLQPAVTPPPAADKPDKPEKPAGEQPAAGKPGEKPAGDKPEKPAGPGQPPIATPPKAGN